MNTEHAITSHHDDVVFENRNKEYGAYFIRRAYDSNLSKGTFASFLFVACLFGVAYAAMMLKPSIPKSIAKDPLTFILDRDVTIIPDHRELPAKQVVRQSSNFPTKVVTQEVNNPPVDVPTTSTTGTADGSVTDANPGPVGINTNVPVEPIAIEPPQIFNTAEVMPEFEGGLKALYKFLRKTLHYPSVAQRTGEEGIVYVRFIIDVSGAVTGIEVMKGVSVALDKEASRVINMMPHWKPGKQHGSPVNVRMTLPIKFEFNKE